MRLSLAAYNFFLHLHWDLLGSGHLIPSRHPQIYLGASQWGHRNFSGNQLNFGNATVKRTKVSSGGVSDRGGELGLNDDIEKRQLRHIPKTSKPANLLN